MTNPETITLFATQFPSHVSDTKPVSTYVGQLRSERVSSIAPYIKGLRFEGRNVIIEYDKNIIKDDADLPLRADGSFDGAAWSQNFKLLVEASSKVAKVLIAHGLEARISTFNEGYTKIELLNNGRSARPGDAGLKLSDEKIQTIVDTLDTQIKAHRSLTQFSSLDFSARVLS